MLFGLHGASFSSAAAMSSVLEDCKEFCGIYHDSIIFSCDIGSHLEHLKIVEKICRVWSISKFREVSIYSGKCYIFRTHFIWRKY